MIGAGLMRGCDRFFWLALYAQPGLWVGLAIFALVRLESPIWLSLNGKRTFGLDRTSVCGFLLTRFLGMQPLRWSLQSPTPLLSRGAIDSVRRRIWLRALCILVG